MDEPTCDIAEPGVTERVADVRGEDASGFDRFYREKWPRFVRLAALLSQDESVAEEIAQDAFAQVFDRWAVLREPAGYLHQCVVNGSRTYHRHHGVVRQKLPVLAGALSLEQHFGELADVVAALPFRQRAVIVLRYWCDLSEGEIAEALGCRPGTVKSLSSRALARLNKEVSE